MLTPDVPTDREPSREHDRPLLRRVPAQREGQARPPRVVGRWSGRVGRARCGRPRRRTSASTSTTRERLHAPPDPRRPRDVGHLPASAACRARRRRSTAARSTAGLGGQALIGSMNVYQSSLKHVHAGLGLRRPHHGRLLVGRGLPRDVRHDDVRRPSEPRRRARRRRTAAGSRRCRRTCRSTSKPSTSSVCRSRTSPCGSRRAPVKSRVCGGCHENRAEDHRHQPRHHAGRRDRSDAMRWALIPRAQRMSTRRRSCRRPTTPPRPARRHGVGQGAPADLRRQVRQLPRRRQHGRRSRPTRSPTR